MAYRRITDKIWTDQRVRAMSPEGKLAFVYTITHPAMNAVGCLRSTIGALAEELKVSANRYNEPITEGLLAADQEALLIVAPRFVRYNPPVSPNCVYAWRSLVPEIPECPLRTEQFRAVADLVIEIGPAFAARLPAAFREAQQAPKIEQHQLFEAYIDALSDPETAPEPKPKIIMEFPLNGRGKWALTELKMNQYQTSYPKLNVADEFRQAQQWLVDNPRKRKMAAGMPSFLTRWLNRASSWRLQRQDQWSSEAQKPEEQRVINYDE